MIKAAAIAACILAMASCGTQMTTGSTQTQPRAQQAEEVQLSAPTPQDTEILVEGISAITSSQGIARDRAIDDALRKAVEQGVGTFITSETQVRNFQLIEDNIFSNSRGYVSGYRIIDEGAEGDLYRVVIRAQVKSGEVEDDLTAIGILLGEQGRPRVMVIVRELSESQDLENLSMSSDVFESRIMEHFRARGFPVVDEATVQRILETDQLKLILQGDDETAMLIGLQAGAEIVVAGTVGHRTSRRTIAGSARDIHSYTSSTRAVNANTGALMAASGFTLELPFSESAARDRAADSTASYLENEILETWTRSENITEMIVTGADYARLQELRSYILENIRGVTDVVTRDLTGNRATVEIVSETSTVEVMDALALMDGLIITAFSGNRIEITLTN